ncbi:MAG: hypothetical protein ACRD5L_09365 [Bryobacteraceae bacterium]
MNALGKRLERLHQRHVERQEQQDREAKASTDRWAAAALSELTDAELEHVCEYQEIWKANPDAKPNLEQQAALQTLQRYYEEVKAAELKASCGKPEIAKGMKPWRSTWRGV